MLLEGDAFEGIRAAAVHNVALEADQLPQRILPGGTNLLLFNISNLGNGPAITRLVAEDLPVGWSYTTMVDGEPSTNSIELSPIYGTRHRALIEVQLQVPSNEDAGARSTVRWSLELTGGGVDVDPTDNAIEWTSVTAAVKIVELGDAMGSNGAAVGGSAFAEALVTNAGNAQESSLTMLATVSASPPNPELVALFTVNGAGRTLGVAEPFNVPASGNTSLRVDLLVPDGMELNTRIVIRFEVLGVVNDEGLPVTMVAEHLVVVDQRRSVSATAVPANSDAVSWDTTALVWVNITSTSTQAETLTLMAGGPDDWQISCQKRLLNASGETIAMESGHLNPQTERRLCEVVNLGTAWEGVLRFTITDSAQAVNLALNVPLNFTQPDEPQGFASGAVVVGGGGVAAAVLIGLLFLRRREREEPMVLLAGPKVTPSLVTGAVGEPFTAPMNSLTVDAEHLASATESTVPVAQSAALATGPPLPEDGLPPGWTVEQWMYYGQQYLDGTL